MLRVASGAVAAVAAAIGAYLALLHLGDRVVPCPVGGGCTAVQRSAYGELGGIPVSLLGAVAGVALVVLALAPGWWPRVAAATLAAGGAAFSLYLTGVEAFVLERWCAWCVASAACWWTAAGLEGVRLWRSAAPDLDAAAMAAPTA